MRDILRNGEKVGEVECGFLATQIDGLVIYNTAIEPHSRLEYEVVPSSNGATCEPEGSE